MKKENNICELKLNKYCKVSANGNVSNMLVTYSYGEQVAKESGLNTWNLNSDATEFVITIGESLYKISTEFMEGLLAHLVDKFGSYTVEDKIKINGELRFKETFFDAVENIVAVNSQDSGEDGDDATYSLTPKGIFFTALIDMGLIDDIDDRRAEVAFELFINRMKGQGLLKIHNED